MKEIDWKGVAEKHNLTPEELEEQIFIAGSIMADMIIDKSGNAESIMQFSCSQPIYNLQLTVKRVYKKGES